MTRLKASLKKNQKDKNYWQHAIYSIIFAAGATQKLRSILPSVTGKIVEEGII